MNVYEIIKKFHNLRANKDIKNPYDQFVLKMLRTKKDELSDEDIMAIINSDKPEPDYNIIRVAISSGALSQEAVISIIRNRQYDEGLCMLAMDAYANRQFFLQLLNELQEYNRIGAKFRRMLNYAIILHNGILTDEDVDSYKKRCASIIQCCELLVA